MTDKMAKMILVLLMLLISSGCSSKQDFPFETLKIIPAKGNKTMSVVVIKTGIKSGATVPFEYSFYFSKDDKTLTRNRIFLSARGLDDYKIKWIDIDTVEINITASRIVEFKSEVLIKDNKITPFYKVGKLIFQED